MQLVLFSLVSMLPLSWSIAFWPLVTRWRRVTRVVWQSPPLGRQVQLQAGGGPEQLPVAGGGRLDGGRPLHLLMRSPS